jgi:hypothetical protein
MLGRRRRRLSILMIQVAGGTRGNLAGTGG